MSNEQLLVSLVQDSVAAAELARGLVHQVQVKDCVLKAEALPALALCRDKLSAAHNAALELAKRSEQKETKGTKG